MLYIPIWFYSNSLTTIQLDILCVLYIPIWFYSNGMRSGLLWNLIFLYIPIWFYSNRCICRVFYRYMGTLHSNLVLFKYRWNIFSCQIHCLYIPIWFYSNQKILASRERITSLYIPIWFYSNGETFTDKIYVYHLYIPIWFYSNFGKLNGEHNRETPLHSNLVLFKWIVRGYKDFSRYYFTFQSGYIQM